MPSARTLIRTAIAAPLIMFVPMIVGLFVPGYDSVSQHMSELQQGDPGIAWIVRVCAMLAGLTVMLFSLGCMRLKGDLAFSWAALAALAFGLSMISNGVFVMGSPLHGLYGLGIFSVLVPAFYVAEFPRASTQSWFRGFSLFCATASLLYLWFLLVGLDPEAYRGLTQRIFSTLSFGWYAIAALTLARLPLGDR